MHWLITILLAAWTFYVGNEVSHGLWDSFILKCWITWPLFLCSILAFAKHKKRHRLSLHQTNEPVSAQT
jgi:hypothetical protein